MYLMSLSFHYKTCKLLRDVEHLMPLLSGYMGHIKVTYTATYLQLTPMLRRFASKQFGQFALPWLDGYAKEDE